MNLPKPLSIRIADTCLIALLAATVLLASRTTYLRTRQVQEYAFSCDTFGYLRMARQIRLEHGSFWAADYRLPYEQTKYLVRALLDADIPVDRWEELVAPHAHHYFPGTNS